MCYEDFKFYTVDEVAKKLTVTKEIIMRLIERKDLEAVVLGDTGIWIIEEQAILELIYKGNNRNGNNGCFNLVNKNEEIGVQENTVGRNSNEVNMVDEEEVKIKTFRVDEEIKGNEVIVELNDMKSSNILKEEVENKESLRRISGNKASINIVKLDKNMKTMVEEASHNPIVISKSDIVKHKDGDYVQSNKGYNEENVIAEFIFDAEQAKKPITDEIVFCKLEDLDNVHIADDQEANERLLQSIDKGKGATKLNFFEEEKKEKNAKKNKIKGGSNKHIKRVKKSFAIDEGLIEQLQRMKDEKGESISRLVEEALEMYLKVWSEDVQVI